MSFVEGVVIDTSDPQQMGRIKVWCPSVDGENYKAESLPWAYYISPLAGQVQDYPTGPDSVPSLGPTAYGFWAIPKVGATVVIGFLYGDCNQRFYLGSYFPDHGNRSLPAGRPAAGGPTTDTLDPLQPAVNNLQAQFDGNLTASEALTRGVYERSVAQALTEKDGTEGYQKSVVEVGLDPQTYCLTTPGHHSLIMQDNPVNGRVRLKTAAGHQLLLDDANERIYISTAKGNTWIELDQDGRVHIHAGAGLSIASGEDINISAAGNFNLVAGGAVNIGAGGALLLSACAELGATGGTLKLTSGGSLDLSAGGTLLQSGSVIHLNGPKAGTATCAAAPVVVPQHEPWVRPASKKPRNPNWKP